MLNNNVRYSPNIIYNLAILSSGNHLEYYIPAQVGECLLEACEINTCSSPLNCDDGLYLPKEYRALPLLDKN